MLEGETGTGKAHLALLSRAMADAPETLICEDLERAIALFGRLGLRLDTISPADDPAVALLSAPGAAGAAGMAGIHVRLVRAGSVSPVPPVGDWSSARTERLADPPAVLRPSYSIVRAGDSPWRTGRAGMLYRDLIPDRQGGRVIASHIRIPDGGPVPDYVHFHAIELQLIYCHRGWVRVVYEDQGEPFVLREGGCVLQPPEIRHRVLEASPGLEVVELGVPAVHATHVEHDRTLPTPALRPDRRFGGQRFVHFQPEQARFSASSIAGFEACELGIASATGGRASVHVVRAAASTHVVRAPASTHVVREAEVLVRSARGAEPAAAPRSYRHTGELLFHFVLRGALTLDGTHPLGVADAFVIPAGQPFTWTDPTADLALLAVALPDAPVTPA